MAGRMSWEDAVRWYRAQPDSEKAILDNYFDLPVIEAARRYEASEEFAEVQRLLGAANGRSILDLGAGNGIASYAFSRQGWKVTALEPNQSSEVGAEAIRSLARAEGLPIDTVDMWGENLQFADNSFDAVHARQVLHHAQYLGKMLSEVARVLKSGGMLLATRDHVADNAMQLAQFKRLHPLHHLYEGENAFPLAEYRKAFTAAGLQILYGWGPLDSILNFYPGKELDRQAALLSIKRAKTLLYGYILEWRRRRASGRLYSFLAVKP